MLRPKALDHVGLSVSDMDQSLRFYQILGLEPLRRSGQDAGGASSAVLKVGDQEINVFCNPDFVPAHGDDLRGIDHFCLMMESTTIDEIIGALRQAGIDIING